MKMNLFHSPFAATWNSDSTWHGALPIHVANEVSHWDFLSRKRLKHQIPQWAFDDFGMVVVCKLVDGTGEDGEVQEYDAEASHIFTPNGLERFALAIANASDTHGIVKLLKGVVWLRECPDGSAGQNIDFRVVQGLLDSLSAAKEKWILKGKDRQGK